MDSNKNDAERCLRIARAAMASGDYARASKFCLKSQRLYPSAEADALLSELKEGWDQETKTSSSDRAEDSAGPSAGVGSAKEEKKTRNGFHQPESASTSVEATAEQIEIVRMINRTKDYYDILGLSKGCSEEEVRKAYRKISLKVHPDKNKAAGAEEAFKAVSKAFQCLSNPELREKYDRYGPEELQNLAHQHGGMRRRHHHEDFFFDDTFDPNEIFNAFFGMQNQPGNGPFQGTHFVYTRGGGFGQGVRGTTQTHSINILGIVQLLSILALFFFSYFPLSQPVYSLEKVSPYQYQRVTKDHGVKYFVKSASFDQDYPPGSQERRNIEAQVERDYKEVLYTNCRTELNLRLWGHITETPSCKKYEQFRI